MSNDVGSHVALDTGLYYCKCAFTTLLERAAMTTNRPQITQRPEQLVLTFAVQGRTVFYQRSSGKCMVARWRPEAVKSLR